LEFYDEIFFPANKYDVSPLVDLCSAFVNENVSATNAFEMLAIARKHGYDAIGKKCLEVACKEAKAAVKSKGFYSLDLDILCQFAGQDEMAIDEIALFRAVHVFCLLNL
jgi:hypothetical protein